MPILVIQLPSDGENADVIDYNAPIQAIVNLVNGGIDKDNLADGAVILSKIADGSITTPKILDKNVTTSKLSPSRFSVSTVHASSRQAIAVNTTADVTGMTVTYTTGSTDETIYIYGAVMIEIPGGGAARLQLQVNGVIQEEDYRTPLGWVRQRVAMALDATANTTYIIKLAVRAESVSANIANAEGDRVLGWVPRMHGFAVAR